MKSKDSFGHVFWALVHSLFEVITLGMLGWGYFTGADVRYLIFVGVIHLGANITSSFHGIRYHQEG